MAIASSQAVLRSLTIAREAYPDLDKHTLTDLARFFDIRWSPAIAPCRTRRPRPGWSYALPRTSPQCRNADRRHTASIHGVSTSATEPKKLLETARRQARVGKGLFGLVHKKRPGPDAQQRHPMDAAASTRSGRSRSKLDSCRGRTVGSSRRETQALTVATRGRRQMSSASNHWSRDEKRYIHHYNMPPTAPARTSRCAARPARDRPRHTSPSERCCRYLPMRRGVPVRIRLVSECGRPMAQTSIGFHVGSTLALMDAGVPSRILSRALRWASCLSDERFAVLTDILGKEDCLR